MTSKTSIRFNIINHGQCLTYSVFVPFISYTLIVTIPWTSSLSKSPRALKPRVHCIYSCIVTIFTRSRMSNFEAQMGGSCKIKLHWILTASNRWCRLLGMSYVLLFWGISWQFEMWCPFLREDTMALTHLPLDKMAAISQTTFWNAFSRRKHFVF